MSSERRSELPDFEAALAVTAGDVAALEAARRRNTMTAHEYLAFLLEFAPRHPPDRSHPPADAEPFTL
jgi:hypothetical protein